MILFTSDWHIRYEYNIKSHPTIYGDIEVSLRQICNYIKQYSPSSIFLLGDTFDVPYVSSKGLSLFNSFVEVCKKGNCKIFYVLGQHDRSNPPLLSTISDYCEHIHGKHVFVDGYDIYGLDCFREPVEVREEADIVVTHQVWKEFIPISGVMGMDNIPNAPLIVSGDFHKPVDLSMGDRMLISPGPIYPVRIYETDSKSIVALDGDNIDRLPIKTRPIHLVRVETEYDADLFLSDFRSGKYTSNLSDYPEGIRKPVLILKYNPELERLADIRAIVGNSCHLEVSFLHSDGDGAEEQQKDTSALEFGSIEDMIRALGDDATVTSLALAYWQHGDKPLEEYFYEGRMPN